MLCIIEKNTHKTHTQVFIGNKLTNQTEESNRSIAICYKCNVFVILHQMQIALESFNFRKHSNIQTLFLS